MVSASITAEPSLKGRISSTGSLKAKISATQQITGRLSLPEKYIPRNYGLITWDGSVMTVS